MSRPEWGDVALSKLLRDAADKAVGDGRVATAAWLRTVDTSGSDEQVRAAAEVAHLIVGEVA